MLWALLLCKVQSAIETQELNLVKELEMNYEENEISAETIDTS